MVENFDFKNIYQAYSYANPVPNSRLAILGFKIDFQGNLKNPNKTLEN